MLRARLHRFPSIVLHSERSARLRHAGRASTVIHTTPRRTASRYKKPAPACFAPYIKGCANKGAGKGAGALYEQLDRYDLRMTSVTTSATKSTFSGFTLYGRSASLCEQAKLGPSMPAMVSERRLMLMAAYASVVS